MDGIGDVPAETISNPWMSSPIRPRVKPEKMPGVGGLVGG